MDEDYKKAKKLAYIALGFWIVSLILFLLGYVFDDCEAIEKTSIIIKPFVIPVFIIGTIISMVGRIYSNKCFFAWAVSVLYIIVLIVLGVIFGTGILLQKWCDANCRNFY